MSLDIWTEKLMAFLHDPPCKVLDIPNHESRARSFRAAAGIPPEAYEKFEKACDWTASAADRFPFPSYSKTKIAAPHNGFKHPFQTTVNDLRPAGPQSPAEAEEAFQQAIGGVAINLPPRLKFFLYWRRWAPESAIHNPALAYLPADTRIPDHTIWSHMAMTSALQTCIEDQQLKPSLLLFQLGPVQEFIAQARSTRDLLSGSYLLSWLTAVAIKAVTDEVGPDAIIFPSLRGQPIYDALHREEIYEEIQFKGDTLWSRMYEPKDTNERAAKQRSLLSPTLTNRFLAIVPQSQAETLGQKAATAAQEALQKEIGTACYNRLSETLENHGIANAVSEAAWDQQLEHFLKPTWQSMPFSDDVVKAFNRRYEQVAETEFSPARNLQHLHEAAISIPDPEDFYYKKTKDTLKVKNIGFYWPAWYDMTDFHLSARRNLRDFSATQEASNKPKDPLSGKEEIIGNVEMWAELSTRLEDGHPLKKEPNGLGAINLIKRLWMAPQRSGLLASYLEEELDLSKEEFRDAIGFESMQAIAWRNSPTNEHPQDLDDQAKTPPNGYVAVLMLDGDDMGKWMSGEKCPPMINQVSKTSTSKESSIREYLERGILTDKKIKRPLSPSFHLQFSEALSNFALNIAGPVVEAFDGRLIYAGGDDVLAVLPSTTVLDCAHALRSLFRGELPTHLAELMNDISCDPASPGWVDITIEGKKIPHLVPGMDADVSCGIAVAHYKHPLQHIVKEAKGAEQRAKKGLGKGAFAVQLLKRGGETSQWGAKWNDGALELYRQFSELSKTGQVSARFANALYQRTAPLRLSETTEVQNFTTYRAKIILEEFTQVCRQQRTADASFDLGELSQWASNYLEKIREILDSDNDSDSQTTRSFVEFQQLFLTSAFLNRPRG